MTTSSGDESSPRIAVVLWSGGIGGAETATLTLARFLRAEGAIVKPVFVGDAGIVGERFEREGFPVVSLGASPGSRILLAPRRAAEMVQAAGPDGAILVSGGILALALRVGGYGGHLIAVEHGGLGKIDGTSTLRKFRVLGNWTSGARLVDVFVGVSNFVVDQVRRHAPGCRAVHIPNGIDTTEFSPRVRDSSRTDQRQIVIGCAGRLIDGKGFEDAIDATVRVASRVPVTLRIAGDGRLRAALESRVQSGRHEMIVTFTGWSEAMPEFWNCCDLAIVPTSGISEAFGMTALEALACGLPVIASDSGGLPEVVDDGDCGLIYPAGNISALSGAIGRLATDPARRGMMGEAARERVLRQFDARIVARAYRDLFEELDRNTAR